MSRTLRPWAERCVDTLFYYVMHEKYIHDNECRAVALSRYRMFDDYQFAFR